MSEEDVIQEEIQDEIQEELQDEIKAEVQDDIQEDVPDDSIARAQGWRPLSEFRGDPDTWVDSKTFLEKSEKNAPMMRERNRKLASMVDAQGAKLAELERSLELQNKMTSRITKKAEEEAYERLVRAQKDVIRDDGMDEDEKSRVFDELEKKKTKISDEYKIEEDAKPKIDPVQIQRWESENQWIYNNPVMNAAANALFADAQRKFPNLPTERHLELVTESIVKEFPHKFENQKRKINTANTGGKPQVGQKKAKGWDDIPETDRKTGERSIRYSGRSRNEWAEEYWKLTNGTKD